MAVDRLAERPPPAHPALAGVEAMARALDAIRRRDSTFRRALALADCIAIGLAVAVGTVLLGDDHLSYATVLAFPLIILAAKIFGLYDRDENLLHKSTLDEIPALFNLATLSALLFWLFGPQIVDGNLGQRQILGIWVLLFLAVIAARSLARLLVRRVVPAERCLFVGDERHIDDLRRKLETTPSINAEVVAWVPIEDWLPADGDREARLSRLGELVNQSEIHRVVIAPGPHGADELLDTIRQVKGRGIKVSVLPGLSQVVGASVELDQLEGITLLGIRRFDMTHSSRLLKRSFDLVGSALMIVLLTPLLLAIAIAARLSSGASPLFTQTRVGRNGKRFQMLKFRTMVKGADRQKPRFRHLNEAEDLFKIDHDPRVTRVGGWLRRTGLDELPQLMNVLRGEMSLVGPRPLIPEEDELIEGWQRRRLDLAPGITGYWQALGSFRIPLRDMVMLDFLYVADWSLWNDVRILLRTVPYVLRRRGR